MSSRVLRVAIPTATALLLVAGMTAIGLAGHDPDKQHHLDWLGHGSEHQPDDHVCTSWQFILTPGGETITAATLHVQFTAGSDVIDGEPSGSQPPGAWHFRFSNEPDVVTEAHASFDTDSGQAGNHVLTLSEAECELAPPPQPSPTPSPEISPTPTPTSPSPTPTPTPTSPSPTPEVLPTGTASPSPTAGVMPTPTPTLEAEVGGIVAEDAEVEVLGVAQERQAEQVAVTGVSALALGLIGLTTVAIGFGALMADRLRR